MSNQHLAKVAAMGCCVCGQDAQAHHILDGSVAEVGIIKGMGMRTPDELAIPLCQPHHSELHANVTEWEAQHGTQLLHLFQTQGITIDQARAIAGAPKPRKRYTPPSKLLPRT